MDRLTEYWIQRRMDYLTRRKAKQDKLRNDLKKKKKNKKDKKKKKLKKKKSKVDM